MTRPLSEKFTAITHIHYGWVIVAVSTLIIGLAYGTMYSYSVFFKPIVASFGWDRATVSSIYSLSLVFRGAVAIGVGWLADRYGAMKLTAFCGVMMGLGLILSGLVTSLWQLYVSYALILSIGLSGSFTIGSAVTAQWFKKRRALALAIVSTGSGMGTLIIVPLAERLIQWHDWSTTFIFFGVASSVLIISAAFLLKPPKAVIAGDRSSGGSKSEGPVDRTLRQAAFSKEMILLVIAFSMLFFCMQMVMIHLVNHATDIGIDSLQAAGLISIIGVVSIAGRLTMGSASARIGTANTLIICISLCIAALAWLLFSKSIVQFYIFAVVFGFSYGGEIPLIPLFIGEFFGVRAMAALIGLLLFSGNVIGAIGPLLGGKIFDLTASYRCAFATALVAAVMALLTAFILKYTNLLGQSEK